MNDEQIVELQTRLAFQEDLIQELNSVVTQQQRDMDDLRRELRALSEHYKALLPSLVATLGEEIPPPHY